LFLLHDIRSARRLPRRRGEGTTAVGGSARGESRAQPEDELGVQLDREQSRATTDASALPRAPPVIPAAQDLRRQLAGKISPSSTRRRSGICRPIIDLAGRRSATHGSELTTERLSGAADALREGRADLAVATKLGIDAAELELELAHFRTVRIVPVARGDHPLAAARGAARRALLRAYAQIVLADSAQAADAPSLNVLRGGVQWRVTDVSSKKEVILAGMGWGGLPEHVVADEPASGALVAPAVPAIEAGVMELYLRCGGGIGRTGWWRACCGRN
jgi:DNA-binding transcriptional LysR family regulator